MITLTQSLGRGHRRPKWVATVFLWAALWALLPSVPAQAAPEWVEPRGLSLVDLVGQVPEEHLQGAILSYTAGGGILRYRSGERQGNQVVLRADVFPRWAPDGSTLMNCLGQRAASDSWPVAVPAATMRLRSGGADITRHVVGMTYYASDLTYPNAGTTGTRYPETGAPVEFTQDGAVRVPANMGCRFVLDGRYDDFIATFTMTQPRQIQVEILGAQTFEFRSYSGPGSSGLLSGLQAQMRAKIGDRHDKFGLSIPGGADYILVNYPATPVAYNVARDSQQQANVRQPSSGAYRLAQGEGVLSVDYTVAMGLPLRGQWRDADQAGGEYLTQISEVDTLAAPEYFVPAGVSYDPCMTDGSCSDSLLDTIANARMTMTVHYYRVGRIAQGLTRVPLRAVGPDWQPGSHVASESQPLQSDGRRLLLPLLHSVPQSNVLPDDPTGCPCGWFSAAGGMVDFIPAP